MDDVAFAAVLFAVNGIVALLNARAYGKTAEARDFAAALAWAGSTAYWLLKFVMGVRG